VLRINKEPKHHDSFWGFLVGTTTRYIYIKDGYYLTMKMISKDNYTVKSAVCLSKLFKVYNEKGKNGLRICFFNNNESNKMANNKKLETKDKNNFLLKLRAELNKYGRDFEFK